MKEKLENLLNNAYAPYSNYKVSCIIKTNDEKEFPGVNVENASYGATICAERSAILNAISNGYKKGDFKEIHIMNSSEKIAFPCFICRQVLIEFFNKDTEIISYNLEGKETIYKVSDLCPHTFSKEDLKND